MKKTGEILRKSREEKGLSLHEVGIFLKINTRILQAIEDGEIEKLPAKTFLRGFVQSYAKYLKLDPNHVLKIFSEELRPPRTEAEVLLEEKVLEVVKEPEVEAPQTEEISPQVISDQKPTSSDDDTKPSLFIGNAVSNDSIKQKMLIISVLGFLLVFIVYIGNNLIRRYQREASLNTDVPVVDAPVAELTEEPKAPETLSSAPEAKNVITALPDIGESTSIVPQTTSSTSEELKKKEDSKPITPANNSTTNLSNTSSLPAPTAATNTQTSSASASTTSAAASSTPTNGTTTNTAATTPPATEKKLPEGKPIEVIIEAKESVEIEYSSARTSPQKLLLKGDQIHTFKSRSGVRLKISNGGAVNVIVNGQDLGAPGAQGQSIQLNYE